MMQLDTSDLAQVVRAARAWQPLVAWTTTYQFLLVRRQAATHFLLHATDPYATCLKILAAVWKSREQQRQMVEMSFRLRGFL